MVNAIYYQDAYLLLPPELPEFGAFLADLRSRALPATYRLLPLLEDNRVRHSHFSRGMCMAPCFLSGYRDEPLSVRIADPSAVYPVQVELLTQEEYNARLCTVVRECCPGCKNYTPISGDEASHAGHHEEISLNGVCSFRWETRSALRKDCRRYGAALAELTWDGQDDGRVAASLALLERKALLSVLHAEAGRAFLLMLNVPMALKELRFRTPLLEAHGSALTVHSATHSRRCTISFDMPFEILD